jgi:hypothetical protein
VKMQVARFDMGRTHRCTSHLAESEPHSSTFATIIWELTDQGVFQSGAVLTSISGWNRIEGDGASEEGDLQRC